MKGKCFKTFSEVIEVYNKEKNFTPQQEGRMMKCLAGK